MSHAASTDGALDLERERAQAAEGWDTWYEEAETFSDRLELPSRVQLSSGDFGRASDTPWRDHVRGRLDIDFERLLDTAPPALAHRLGMIAAVAGHYRYSWPLLRAAAHAMPAGSAERRWAVHNWHLAALEANAWSSALESVEMLGRECPVEAPFPLARFEPVRMLGAGGFAEVYLCRAVESEELVVVKAMARKPAKQWPRDVFHEVRLLQALTSPGVPRVREFGYVDPERERGPYCVLEYFDALSLHQYIECCGALSWMNLRPILVHVLDTLEAVHQAGIIHCDVKPGNVLLHCDSRGWRTELIDFGIAVRQAEQDAATNVEERRPGTIGFAPPEQLGCPFATPITPAADVYSLAQTAVYALTALPPGKWQSDHALQAAGPMGEVLLSCLHHDPRQRPRIEQLRRYLQQIDLHQEPLLREHQTTRLPQALDCDAAMHDPITGFGTVASPNLSGGR